MKPGARRHWWRVVAICAIVAPLLGYAALTWLLDPQRLGAALLHRAERTSGLALTTATPATLGVWPRLHLELDGLRAGVADAAPLLTAERIEIALPLSVLWTRRAPVGAVAMQAPRIDLDAVQAWLRTRADTAAAAAPTLPSTLTVSVRDALIDGGDWRFAQAAIDVEPRDRSGIRLSATARLQAGDLDMPVSVEILGTPRETAIEALQIALSPDSGPPWLQLRGTADYARTALVLELSGRLHAWPASWPPPPAALLPLLTERTVELRYHGDPGLQAALQLSSAGSDDELRIATAPAALIAWWRSEPRAPLPPGTVHATRTTTRIGGLQIDGLRIDLDHEPAE